MPGLVGGTWGTSCEGRSLGSVGITLVDSVSAPLYFMYVFNRAKKPLNFHLNIFQVVCPRDTLSLPLRPLQYVFVVT